MGSDSDSEKHGQGMNLGDDKALYLLSLEHRQPTLAEAFGGRLASVLARYNAEAAPALSANQPRPLC